MPLEWGARKERSGPAALGTLDPGRESVAGRDSVPRR